MSYEEIKQQFVDYFLSKKFEQVQPDVLTRVEEKVVGNVTINGSPIQQKAKVKIDLICLGEGFVDDNPTIGWNIKIDDNDQGDVWIDNISSFDSFIKI